jgi:hypothetical protein
MPGAYLLLLVLHATPSAIIVTRALLEGCAAKSVLVSAILLAAISLLSVVFSAGSVLVFHSPVPLWLIAIGINLWACVFPIWKPTPQVSSKRGQNAL